MRTPIPPRPRRYAVATLAASLVAAGCSLGPSASFPPDSAAHAARDVPVAFESPAGPAPDGACRNPMHDPRDGATLILVRSTGGRGDYQPPAGRYGVAPDELLRLECSSGRPIGIVAR